MAHIKCVDCIKTYRPYSYSVALLRVLMYGFSNRSQFEDECVIENQFRERWRNRFVRELLIDKTENYRRDDSFVEDFNFFYLFLENKRRKNISATFLCFDCEKYYCTNCVSKHSRHFTFSKDDKCDISNWGTISDEMLDRLTAEGDQKLENMGQEQSILCDIVDVKCEHDKLDLDYVIQILKRQASDECDEIRSWGLDLLANCGIKGTHILNDNKKWLVTDYINKRVKIFDVNDSKMTRCIKFLSWPFGITEIPSTEPLQSLIAVSFPFYYQIDIMNIHSTPAQVVSSIYVRGTCHDLAYCNNKLITRCEDFRDGHWHHSINVMDMSGKIIKFIDLNKDYSIEPKYLGTGCICVHSESEIIYVCHERDPPYVFSLSLDGQVLHSVTFTDPEPRLICVDKEQNVYVMTCQLAIYKLSSDLSWREKIFDKDVGSHPFIQCMTFHNNKFYLASNEGLVYIIQYDSS